MRASFSGKVYITFANLYSAIQKCSTYDGQISIRLVYYCNLKLSCPKLGITECHSGSDPEVLINYGFIIFDSDGKLKCNGSFFFRWWRLILKTCSVQFFFSRPFDARSIFVSSLVYLENFCSVIFRNYCYPL